MRETRLDDCTKRLVGTALGELRGPLGGFARDANFVGELSQRLRAIVARELENCDGERKTPIGLADELALATYLTVTAQGTAVRFEPHWLASLTRSLDKTLNESRSPDAETDLKEVEP